MQQDNTTIV